jgi:hypothetical protein
VTEESERRGMDKERHGEGANLVRYEDILRAVGRFIDEQGLQDVVVVQASDKVRVHGFRNVSKRGVLTPQFFEHTFTSEEIRQIDEVARARRGTGSQLYQ